MLEFSQKACGKSIFCRLDWKNIFCGENNNTDYILMRQGTTIMQCAVYDTYVTKKTTE